MPPRAFPYSLKVGIDICHIPRIRSIITKNIGKGEKEALPLSQFLSKVLTWPEAQYFRDRFGEGEAAFKDISKVSRFLAGRWAAKEACRKACTHLGMSNGMHHIMILPISNRESVETGVSSAPRGLILRDYLRPFEPPIDDTKERLVRSSALEGRPYFDINKVEGQFCEISISHDNDFAQAVALVPPMEWARENERSVSKSI